MIKVNKMSNKKKKSSFAAGTIDAVPAPKPVKDMKGARDHNKTVKASFTSGKSDAVPAPKPSKTADGK
jgi:hypothetical protein